MRRHFHPHIRRPREVVKAREITGLIAATALMIGLALVVVAGL